MQGLCSPPSWAGCVPTCDGHGHWGGSGTDCGAARYEPALPTGACLVPKLSPPHGRGCLLRGKCRELPPARISPPHAEKPVLSVLCLCTARNREILATCGRLSRTIPCPYTAAMLWLCFWLQFGQHRQLCFIFLPSLLCNTRRSLHGRPVCSPAARLLTMEGAAGLGGLSLEVPLFTRSLPLLDPP